MFGHGLKHLFHSRRRSREREHQAASDPSAACSTPGPQTPQASTTAPLSSSDHDSADEKERSPEMHRVSYAVSLHDLPARPTAFNRVLQQIRSRPSVKRGSGQHGSGRRSKSGPGDTAHHHHHHQQLRGGSPHLPRRPPPMDGGLAAVLQHHQGRPRSSSTTDAAMLAGGDAAGAGGFLHEDQDRATEKVCWITSCVIRILCYVQLGKAVFTSCLAPSVYSECSHRSPFTQQGANIGPVCVIIPLF